MKAFCRSVVFILAFSVLGICQEKGIDLRDKRITIKMEQQPLGEVFQYLMENYDIPIGFEESTLDRGLPDYKFHTNLPTGAKSVTKSTDGSITFTTTLIRAFKAERHSITIKAENERLEEVFDKIVEQMQNYKWEINDGVVNIFPVKGRDERFERLLGLNIPRFTFEKGQTVKDITTRIQSLHEFLRFMGQNKLVFYGVRQGANFVLKVQYGRKI